MSGESKPYFYIHYKINVHTCEMQPPRPMPSNNWWKVSAATRGLIVLGLIEAPKEIPIITECTTIPSSNTYIYNKFKIYEYPCFTIYKKHKIMLDDN